MVDYNAPLYQNKPEVWDEAKCRRMARKRTHFGQKMHFPGLICGDSSPYPYGDTRYNGGCEREGQWWQGENRPLPIIHEDYEIVVVPSWGWRIKRKDSE